LKRFCRIIRIFNISQKLPKMSTTLDIFPIAMLGKIKVASMRKYFVDQWVRTNRCCFDRAQSITEKRTTVNI
jgi:hypothetical protein